VVQRARELGFELCGVAPAEKFPELEHLPEWLERGYAGEMRYLHDARRHSPQQAMPGARSVVVCAMNYNTPLLYSTDVVASLRAEGRGWISRYAWGDDYHQVLGEKLERLVGAMHGEFAEPHEARWYVDTGPIVERIAAKWAGLGWLGKNTCLINRDLGSWLFLGVITTTMDLAPSLAPEIELEGSKLEVGSAKFPAGAPVAASAPATSPWSRPDGQRSPTTASDAAIQHSPLAAAPDLCGQCTQCIDACPTGAIVEPYVLDARRCISYLTIELRGPIPEEFHAEVGWHLFGCDICQDVCPYNRNAPVSSEPRFLPRRIEMGSSMPEARSADTLFAPSLEWVASLSEDDFRAQLRHSPIRRTKYSGLSRNAGVANRKVK